MTQIIEISLPLIGDFTDVSVIEVLVAPGDVVEAQDSIITLESEKASMEIPTPFAGTVRELLVKVGNKVSKGCPILTLELAADVNLEQPPAPNVAPVSQAVRGVADLTTEILVLGGGPGGYTAAFRAADLGKKVVIVERHSQLGGVCLNVGCIPSKALLHAAEIIREAAEIGRMGIRFGAPEIDLDALRAGKDKVVQRLTQGLAALAKQRQVTVLQGSGRFESPNRLLVTGPEGKRSIAFDRAIIACGSRPVQIPGFPQDDPRLMNSSGALALRDIPAQLLVLGGGIIGLEMATVYAALGSQVDVVELQPQLIPGCDPDLVKVLRTRIARQYRQIWTGTRVTDIQPETAGLRVSFAGSAAPAAPLLYDRVLVAVGRVPNGKQIGAEHAGVNVDERGFIHVDAHQRTNVPNIYAIGDVVGNPMLAHKATHEAKVAAEVIAGLPARFDPLAIPAVAYTDPEIAWMGLTETVAKANGIAYKKGVFPWAASGRALGIGREEGLTKLLFDPQTKRILGAGIVGRNAGELIGETVLALEMGADAEDLGLIIHPHPTLNETIGLAAEVAEGCVTDLPASKKPR